MLDIKLIRDNPDSVASALKSKNDSTDLGELLALDSKRRELITGVESLKNKQNEASKKIPQAKKAGEDVAPLLAEMKAVSQQVAEQQATLGDIEAELQNALLHIPNLPHCSAPVGSNETDNVERRRHGDCESTLPFDGKDHVDIAESLDIIDFKRATKLSGAGFALYKGQGARLLRGLLRFCLDIHIEEHGYTEFFAPYLVLPQTMQGTGQLPKFKEDMYYCEADDQYLIPTAEVPVTNIYAGEMLAESDLPMYLTGYTTCFRREAGSHGKDVRGLKRLHQFDKVEMVKLVKPDSSYDELESLTANAETILQRLGLSYRVLELCSGDMSFSAAKCYDLELWAPGSQSWLEVSSCSNFEDFQARRANIRFKPSEGGKPQFVHTLNGSGVAMPRLMIALLETHQQEDGSVLIPEPLRDYVKADKIGPA